jgi:hypothetical protein
MNSQNFYIGLTAKRNGMGKFNIGFDFEKKHFYFGGTMSEKPTIKALVKNIADGDILEIKYNYSG